MDYNSRCLNGVGYIEFYDASSVPIAIKLSGQPLIGEPVMVKPFEAKKNLVQSSTAVVAGGAIGPYSGGARKLYVGNLVDGINEAQLRQVFEPFGALELVQLPFDKETGKHHGYGFVQFVRLEDASAALCLDGYKELVLAICDQMGIPNVEVNAGSFDDDDGNVLSSTAVFAGGAIGPYSGEARKLYVGNLFNGINEAQLRQIFDPFGALELVQLPLDKKNWRTPV